MIRDIKFSILIPVYNDEKYLRQCIDSVLMQDYDNMEIILVDDGSTDSSGKICNEYAKKDSRIKVIHKENEGVFSARMTAIESASGDYFLFVDSDDYWNEGLLRYAYDTIKKYNCDMILFNYSNVYPNRTSDNIPLFSDESVFEGDNKKKIYQLALEGYSLNNLVLKIVSKNIIDYDANYKKYYDINKGEDALQSTPLLIAANKIIYLSGVFYNYRRNVGVTRKINAVDIASITKVRENIVKLFEKTSVKLEESISKNYDTYMENLIKYIVYGYIDNKLKFKYVFKEVVHTDYYKSAKVNSYGKLPLLNKLIISSAEKQIYFFLKIFSYVIKLRNFMGKI